MYQNHLHRRQYRRPGRLAPRHSNHEHEALETAANKLKDFEKYVALPFVHVTPALFNSCLQFDNYSLLYSTQPSQAFPVTITTLQLSPHPPHYVL